MKGSALFAPSLPGLQVRKFRGVTLIEVVVLIVIIGIMAAIVTPVLFDQPDRARYSTARTDLKTIGNALELYQLQERRFPSTEAGLEALVRPADALPSSYSTGVYLLKKEHLTDPGATGISTYHPVSTARLTWCPKAKMVCQAATTLTPIYITGRNHASG